MVTLHGISYQMERPEQPCVINKWLNHNILSKFSFFPPLPFIDTMMGIPIFNFYNRGCRTKGCLLPTPHSCHPSLTLLSWCCNKPPENSGKNELHVLLGWKINFLLHGPCINVSANFFIVAFGFSLGCFLLFGFLVLGCSGFFWVTCSKPTYHRISQPSYFRFDKDIVLLTSAKVIRTCMSCQYLTCTWKMLEPKHQLSDQVNKRDMCHWHWLLIFCVSAHCHFEDCAHFGEAAMSFLFCCTQGREDIHLRPPDEAPFKMGLAMTYFPSITNGVGSSKQKIGLICGCCPQITECRTSFHLKHSKTVQSLKWCSQLELP